MGYPTYSELAGPAVGTTGVRVHDPVAENDRLMRDVEAALLSSPPSGTDLRRESLREVEACVCKDRQNTYGDAEDNFAHIAAIANVALANSLKVPLTPLDVATFSACIKLARILSSPMHLDNWTDLAGYAVCGAGIVKREKLKTPVLSQP